MTVYISRWRRPASLNFLFQAIKDGKASPDGYIFRLIHLTKNLFAFDVQILFLAGHQSKHNITAAFQFVHM